MNILENKTKQEGASKLPWEEKTRISQEKVKKSKRRGLLDSEAWAVWSLLLWAQLTQHKLKTGGSPLVFRLSNRAYPQRKAGVPFIQLLAGRRHLGSSTLSWRRQPVVFSPLLGFHFCCPDRSEKKGRTTKMLLDLLGIYKLFSKSHIPKECTLKKYP